MLRIIHIIPKFSSACWGGAESVILRLSLSLASAETSHEVWTTDSVDVAGRTVVEGASVRRFRGFFLTARQRAEAGIGRAPVAPALLLALLVVGSNTIVHVHCHNKLSSLVVLCCRARRIPCVVTVHGEFKRLTPRWRYSFVTEYAVKRASVATCVQPSVLRVLEEIRDGRYSVHVPNGVDTRLFGSGNRRRGRASLGLTEDVRVVLLPGRVCELKNQVPAIRAVAGMRGDAEGHSIVHLVIAGPASESEYMDEVLRAIRELSVADRIHVVDPYPANSSALADAYAAADAVMVPSRFEAFPVVVLEAWAAGRPVVATAAGGLAEIIVNGHNGILVSPGDAHLPERLAEALESLLADEDLRDRVARGGLGSARTFDWEGVLGEYGTIYERLRSGAAHSD